MNDALSIAQALIRCPSVAPLEAGARGVRTRSKTSINELLRD